MNIPPSYSERQRKKPISPASSAILPGELMAEVLSYLDVKSLLKIRCVSKSLKSLISDPTFVRLHLERSQRNPQFALYAKEFIGSPSVVPFPLSRLLDNPLNTLPTDSCYDLMGSDLMDNECEYMVGSCNGLICLKGFRRTPCYKAYWFCFWNPATRIVSKKLGYFCDYRFVPLSTFNYMFGYDNSTSTYKLVALHTTGDRLRTRLKTDVKVLSLGDNVWRNIQNLPLVPFPFGTDAAYGVDFRGSLNWLSLPSYADKIDYAKFVITSFDLSTETCMQFLPPPSFDGSQYIVPHIRVLVDCLCFCHDVERTHLVIWKMTEFGVQESWTQFLKISYQSLYIDSDFCDWKKDSNCRWLPLHLSENSDTLIFSNRLEDAATFYNWRDSAVKKLRITQKIQWRFSLDYGESLVSPC